MIRDAPRPTNPTGLRNFLGMVGFYRLYIRNFAFISTLLHAGTSVARQFVWMSSMENLFKLLKDATTFPLVLAFPDFDNAFVVESDAFVVAIGAVLAQKKQD